MISHFDFDAPQLPVAFGVYRVISEYVSALDARENPVVDSRSLYRLFQVFRPSASQLCYAGDRQLLAKQGLGASIEVIVKRWSLRAPPPARSGLKQLLEERSHSLLMLF